MIPVPRVLGVLAAVALAATGCRQFAKPEVPTFLVSPSSLSFAARAGGLNPPHQFLTISETDAQPLGWTASTNEPWISLTSQGDTLPYFLGVGVGTGLAVGTYSGAIAVVRPSTGDVRAIPVTLTLLATTPLAGRWSGVRDSVTVTLTLAEGGGKASGVGSLAPPQRVVQVTGTYAYPSVSLALAASTDTANLTGSFVDDNSIAATLSSAGLGNVSLTLYRQ